MKTILSFLLGAILFASCSLETIPPVKTDVNEIDRLSISITNMKTYSGTDSYAFSCTSDTCELSFGGYLESGLIKIKYVDPDGTVQFNQTYTAVSGNVFNVYNSHGTGTFYVEGVNANGTFSTVIRKK